MSRIGITLVITLLALVACSANPAPNEGGGPRLVGESALQPTEPLATRIISPTPERTATQPTLEIVSPLEQVTVEADFVLVTPTLPPSKTPTSTPTISATPTESPTPTVTVTATATSQAFPTSIIIPVTAPVVEPIAVVCDSQWFFIEPRPASCPLAPPSVSQGVYQTFENGHMVWVSAQDAIYVMYDDAALPRWEVWRDEFDEGEPEWDPNWSPGPPNEMWQPRRGFGDLWRREQAVRDRIGWATLEWEEPYSTRVQIDEVGTVFVDDPSGRVFSLLPGGEFWQIYSGGITTGGPTVTPIPPTQNPNPFGGFGG